jgi:hypothetical protein
MSLISSMQLGEWTTKRVKEGIKHDLSSRQMPVVPKMEV